jgi:hypothetical protein
MLTTLTLLGAFHGLNPAMGWLFAVSRGLQEGRVAGVLRALPPIALGHALSIAAVVALVTGARQVVPLGTLRVVGAIALLAVGAWRLRGRRTHPRWVGMRVGFRDLTLWSFLMATAHGAGLMLIPVLVRMSAPQVGHDHTAAALAPPALVLAVHTAAVFAVMAGVALAVYRVLGLAFLRRGWMNIDLIWAIALIVAAGVTLIV